MASIINDIKNGNIAGLYLFYGEESFKKRNFKDLLINAVTAGNTMNYSYFEGKDIDYQALYDAVVTMPFFAAKRLVVVENSGKFKASKSDEEESVSDAPAADASADSAKNKKEKKSSDMLEKILNDLPETTCLAFFEETVAKNKKVYKSINKQGVVVECTADSEEQIINWLAVGFSQAGKKVRKSTLKLLIQRAGLDYDNLRTEYEKILGYIGDRSIVEDSDVLTMTSEPVESKIFDLLDAMGEKNVRVVMKKYSDLIENKEHPLYIMAMLRNQLRNIIQVAEEKKKGLRRGEIASTIKKAPFVVERAEKCLKYFTADDVIKMLDEIAEIDKQSKLGDIQDQIAVEILLVKFSS